MTRPDRHIPRNTHGVYNDCSSGKRAYYTRRLARHFQNANNCAAGEKLRAYRCDECGMWHLGHTDKKGAQRGKSGNVGTARTGDR